MKKLIGFILTISLILGTGAFLVNAETVPESSSEFTSSVEASETSENIGGGIKVNPDEYYEYEITVSKRDTALDLSAYEESEFPCDFYGVLIDSVRIVVEAPELNMFVYTITLNEEQDISPVEAKEILDATGAFFEIGLFHLSEYQTGDINGDRKLTAADYLKMKKAIFGTYTFTHEELGRADVTYDNLVTAADYLKLKRYIFTGYNPYSPYD